LKSEESGRVIQADFCIFSHEACIHEYVDNQLVMVSLSIFYIFLTIRRTGRTPFWTPLRPFTPSRSAFSWTIFPLPCPGLSRPRAAVGPCLALAVTRSPPVCMLSADTHPLSGLPAVIGFNARRLLLTLLAACVFGAAAIPGIDVDSAADDRELFRKLEEQTNALAEKGDVAVDKVASTSPVFTSPTPHACAGQGCQADDDEPADGAA
jgi:hypothetical protein